ncbi:glucose-6-phosphate dehydrogenase [Paeniglutamicibacter cryotolerans]|uniref:Glucose-6-phosphate 1-dehydrogenase n=1 Tax=Paeniglutamicibacter cryotolerans TaxID=670079 RepID=A0A839QRI2_9MICC|nr:glucose-6-phosphate dehydrogenase [Paeniglutamicibacter cryotolerans]MBB2997394.1 glucose-6-phosphate 1-dehydrogenase [Paeniglutamicibacter cryotolerans]
MDMESVPDTGSQVRTLLVLGASGDLTGRLLLPGLARLLASGRAPGLMLAGAGSADFTPADWHQRVDTVFASAKSGATPQGSSELDRIAANTSYSSLDVTAPGELSRLLATLPGPIAVYFALPPAVSQRACEALVPGELPEGTLFVMEKPFGSDAVSARALNQTLVRLVPEANIHRVDHFLGKGTVFNILGLRFANRILEPVFSADHVAKMEIFYDEDLALEDRAGYYDHAGALRDMIQSHLLQILALLTMNAPATLGERDVRDHLGSVLRATSVAGTPADSSRRARYAAGTSQGRQVPDYASERGVDPARGTETLAEVTLKVNNSRWAGVPFILRAGKALGVARKEAVITFKPVAHLPDGFKGIDFPTTLRIGFGPDTLQLDLDVNSPGDLFTLDRVTLEAELSSTDLLPYGEVLLGVLSGDPTLSVRGDTAEECWRIVDPVLAAWAADEVPLEEYPAGGPGPAGWDTNGTAPQ